jgi:hypothetical protein
MIYSEGEARSRGRFWATRRTASEAGSTLKPLRPPSPNLEAYVPARDPRGSVVLLVDLYVHHITIQQPDELMATCSSDPYHPG